jgi:hypothetical protein
MFRMANVASQAQVFSLVKQHYQEKNCWNVLIWVTDHCNRAAVSRNRYGVEKTVDTHKILINAITFYVCLQEI